MADNVPISAGTGTNIASDDIGGVQYQRVKATFGLDGVATDVSSTNPLPVVDPDASTTGTITAPDAVVGAPAGAGATVTGASTAGSIVAIACPGGDSAWNLQISGTLGSSTYYYEGSLDSTNGTDGTWINVNGRQTGIVNTVLAGNTTTAGIFRGNTSGLVYFRVRAVGGAAPTAVIRIRVSAGTGATFLNASVPAGSNIIGKVGIDQTTPGTTNLVALAANQSVNAAQIAGVATSTGVGASGTGTQRVVTATDSTIGTVTTLTTITNTVPVASKTATTGGATSFTLISAASTNATSVKASAGTLYSINAYNNGATAAYLKLFNLAVAPTVGTSVAVMTIMLPAASGSNITLPATGVAFGTGISFSITGVGTTADTTAVAAAQCFINGSYA